MTGAAPNAAPKRRKLDMMIGAAVGALLVGRTEITLGEALEAMPDHVRAARPTHKAIARAIVAAGWEAKRCSGHIVYRPAAEPQDGEDAPERGTGDNSVAGEQLRLLIERVERLMEERKGITGDIKDVFGEAKATGFDVTAMRAVIRLRATEKHHRDEAEAILETYRLALGV